jgi:site-specific DNA-methyltransferase (adenine-specific)
MDRSISKKDRQKQGFPFEDTISKELFMELTLDTWKIRPESAKRVGHPAPFPIELPRRFIELFTYKGDLVLDPFIGAGSTAVAAKISDRNFIGYDLDKNYVELSRKRVREAIASDHE